MKKSEYFLLAIKEEAFKYKAWVIHAFSLSQIPESDDFLLRLYPSDKHYYFKRQTEDGEIVITLEDTNVKEPPFNFKESINLKAGDVVNLNENITSTYGKLLVNLIGLAYPLGNKIPYINGKFDLKKIESEIERRLTTDPEHQTSKDYKVDNPIYVSEYLKFVDCLLSLEGYAQLSVPSASAKSMTTDPRIPELRAQLLEKYKDSLHDPATIAKIEAELIKMDKEWIKGDISEGFYDKAKQYEVARKKLHLMHGYERPFDGEVGEDVIPTSLSDGWNIEKMPAMVNSLREGSYNRGHMTAQGGYATKIVNRMLQNLVISEEDCGSKLGLKFTVTKKNAKDFIGFFKNSNKGPIEITEDNYQENIDKEISLRSPLYCKSDKTGYCETCLGKPNSENEHALVSLSSEITSQLMYISMGKMHGTSLKTAKYIPGNVIS